MNVIKNHVKVILNYTSISQVKHCIARDYACIVPENYPVPYKKLEKLSPYHPKKSGDLGLEIDVKSDDYCLYYGQLKELQDADELVKKMFTLKYHRKREIAQLKSHKAMEMVMRHKYDFDSPEVKVARMTCHIQILQKNMEEFPRNTKQKVLLLELIHRRNKYLKNIRSWDYKCFEWLIEKLNIAYRAPLEDIHEKVTKKGSLRKRTDQLCEKIVQQKLDAYKDKLNAEKKIFFNENLQQLLSIREQELAYGLKPTVTEEDIENAKQKVKQYC